LPSTREIKADQQILNQLTTEFVPQLVAQFAVGADIERVRFEAAFAKLCDVTSRSSDLETPARARDLGTPRFSFLLA